MTERKKYLLLFFIWISLLFAAICTQTLWLALTLFIIYIPLFDRSRKNPYLPSLMYHSVSDNYKDFPKSQLSVSLRNFRWAMSWLRFRGYTTIRFDEAEAFTHGKLKPGKYIHLTFDDGYLDNWVNVWPILKKFKMTGTVFVTDDFIDRNGKIRPARDLNSSETLKEWGFMNEAEILSADESGVFEFLPHGKTHTWFPIEDRLIGFHVLGDRQIWLDWNLSTERKRDWISEFPQDIAGPGYPILAFGKSLEIKRFKTDDGLLRKFQQEVHKANIADDLAALKMHWEDFRKRYPFIGSLESDEEKTNRLREELGSVKQYLEQLLGKPCDYLCWPGGGKLPESINLATEEFDYKMMTTHQYATANRINHPSKWLYRVSGGNSLQFENPIWNLMRFVGHVETYRRNYCYIWLFALCHGVEGYVQKMGRKGRKQDCHLPLMLK